LLPSVIFFGVTFLVTFPYNGINFINQSTMKTEEKSVKSKRNFGELISKLSGGEILDLNSMMCIRGGDGDGGTPIIPPPPKKI
jgi:hypothetical protein